VAFEFRLRGRRRGKAFWTAAFAGGSATAAFAQGLVLGGFIQGVTASPGPAGPAFSGGALDWLTPYTLLVAVGLVAGYALLGATWLMIKMQDQLHHDARRWSLWAAALTAAFLGAVSVATLLVHPMIAARWGFADGAMDWGKLLPLLPIPALGAFGLALAAFGAAKGWHRLPYLGAVLVFLSGYLGLAAGFFPYVAPYHLTFRQAAAADNALGLMLAGAAVLLPLILAYTAWAYWVFRGKVTADAGYH